YVIQWWSDLHGRASIAELYRQGRVGEDPIITYKRMYGLSQSNFNAEMLRGYQHLVNFDFTHARRETRPYACTFTCKLDTLSYGWLQPENMPEEYGFNAIPLLVGKKRVRVELKGDNVLFGFVGVTSEGESIYGDAGNPVFTCPKDKVLKNLYLVVMGAPSEHTQLQAGDGNSTTATFPYKFRVR
ncbi:MAG: hypothetical protein J5671_00715, partial [Bacteroidaceae bacterium]|nr:hypothetical protein [Bacteroidaceae bacterium]